MFIFSNFGIKRFVELPVGAIRVRSTDSPFLFFLQLLFALHEVNNFLLLHMVVIENLGFY